MITGASSGLGEALAHEFYKSGCRIILVSRRKGELERVKNSLMETHHVIYFHFFQIPQISPVSQFYYDWKFFQTIPTHPPIVLPLDLTELNSLPAEIDKVLTIHGHIDVLINNAGISYRGEVVNTNVNVDIKVMLVNYFAQIALSKGNDFVKTQRPKKWKLRWEKHFSIFICSMFLAVLPSMISRRSGHIVCVSSVQGKIAIPYR